MILIGPHHTYTEKTEREVQDENVDFRTTYTFWGNNPVYQERSSLKHSFSIEGPLTESWKKHGKWKIENWQDQFEVEYEWYWYGEEISEGEWHLRNRE